MPTAADCGGLFGCGASGAGLPVEGLQPKPAASVAGSGSRRNGPRIGGEERRNGSPDAAGLASERHQIVSFRGPPGGDYPEFCKVSTKGIYGSRALPDKKVPGAVNHEHALLLFCLARHTKRMPGR